MAFHSKRWCLHSLIILSITAAVAGWYEPAWEHLRSFEKAFSALGGPSTVPTKVSEANFLPFHDKRIKYVGRFDLSGSAARFVWSGSQISFRVIGGGILSATLTSGLRFDRFDIFIDSEFHTSVLLNQSSEIQRIQIADLSSSHPGPHTVTIWKATEDFVRVGSGGLVSFHGLTIQGGGNFSEIPEKVGRRLEFIGDSDTAGWCSLGSPSSAADVDESTRFEDNSKTWAAQLANRLDAEAQFQAVSGFGVTDFSKPIQPLLDYIDGFGESLPWNSSLWTPDAVIVLIGPNDYNHAPSIMPSDAEFVTAYTSLLLNVAKRYEHATPPPQIINVCGGSINGLAPCTNVEKASSEWNRKADGYSRFKSHFVSLNESTWKQINADGGSSKFNGCQMHYNSEGHRVVAASIEPEVRKILKGQSTRSSIFSF
eukprot:TRINITY_DN7217_c0_g3_i1.p1 TRINITY_DN7217_c0_g3~~TRINITY_DN7217_c0_g3_i1.p1  ORF type:complete len:426 (+),score=40.96 TRINITY_DN7217_c0_g3_i1:61-1338(+)